MSNIKFKNRDELLMKITAITLITSSLVSISMLWNNMTTNVEEMKYESSTSQVTLSVEYSIPDIEIIPLERVEIPETEAPETFPPETEITIPETEPSMISPVPPATTKPYYTVTEWEREILARIVFLEAGICSAECQRAIASVIFNRLQTGYWGSTIHDVIYFPTAFSPAYLIDSTVPHEGAYAAVDFVIQYGSTLPPEVRYFRLGYDFSWSNYVNYTVMDNVYFGYLTTWLEGAW